MDEGDRLMRLIRVFDQATHVFANREKALYWMTKQKSRFNERRPIQMLRTDLEHEWTRRRLGDVPSRTHTGTMMSRESTWTSYLASHCSRPSTNIKRSARDATLRESRSVPFCWVTWNSSEERLEMASALLV
jgi:Protein of unknown function (DUF2384)